MHLRPCRHGRTAGRFSVMPLPGQHRRLPLTVMADFGALTLRRTLSSCTCCNGTTSPGCRQLPPTAISLSLILDLGAISVSSRLNALGSLAPPAPPRLTCTCCRQGQNVS